MWNFQVILCPVKQCWSDMIQLQFCISDRLGITTRNWMKTNDLTKTNENFEIKINSHKLTLFKLIFLIQTPKNRIRLPDNIRFLYYQTNPAVKSLIELKGLMELSEIVVIRFIPWGSGRCSASELGRPLKPRLEPN